MTRSLASLAHLWFQWQLCRAVLTHLSLPQLPSGVPHTLLLSPPESSPSSAVLIPVHPGKVGGWVGVYPSGGESQPVESGSCQ